MEFTHTVQALHQTAFIQFNLMADHRSFDVIIIGGSYAGLSAGMALGRALRNVLIIDSGMPCNRQSPHAHNFITQDGEKPGVIADKARKQTLNYSTVQFHTDLAVSGIKSGYNFEITTQDGNNFTAKRLIFATGVKDNMPEIEGYSDCWGTSVIHCPYCHGYEVKHAKTGILANGDSALHYAQLISNWTKDLTIFTNGKSTLTQQQTDAISRHNISIIEKEIAYLKHENGLLKQIVCTGNATFELKAIYAQPNFEQHCKIPELLGCELTDQGHIKVDTFLKTSMENVFACGDSISPMRSVANAVATGNLAGAIVNNFMTEEEF